MLGLLKQNEKGPPPPVSGAAGLALRLTCGPRLIAAGAPARPHACRNGAFAA